MVFSELLTKLNKNFKKVKIIYTNGSSEIFELAKINKNALKSKNVFEKIKIENLKEVCPIYNSKIDQVENKTLFELFAENSYELID